MTKHPVVNKDGSNTVLKVQMSSGREVTATKAKSFLKRVDNKIVQVNGDEIKVGDRLPVSRVLLVGEELSYLELAKYLPRDEWLYTSEVPKAFEYAFEEGWWSKHNGRDFVLPYKDFKSFTDVLDANKGYKNYGHDCVYPSSSIETDSKIPDCIPLDECFGFFIGSYIARGRVSKDTIIIEVDDNLSRLEMFLDTYNIKYSVSVSCTESTILTLHCSVLSSLMENYFEDCIPVELLAAPKAFIRELINGCIYGAGTLSSDRSLIHFSSTSMPLLETMQQMLLHFGTVSSITSKAVSKSCFPFKFGNNVANFPTLSIPYNMFNNGVGMASIDIVPDVKLGDITIASIERGDVKSLLQNTRYSPADIAVLESVLNEDIVYDMIVSITEVENECPYVYDLTVEETRNFNTFTGICMADTFHSAGISSASKAVRGVPRLQELLNVTKKIKTPIMTIHVKPHYRIESATKEEYKSKCMSVLNELSTTRFKDIITKAEIHYDPNDFDSKISEDRKFIEMYKLFNDLTEQNKKVSPWLLRFEFDRQRMVNIGIGMIDLQNVLHVFYDDKVACMFSDDNAAKLIMRIKLTSDSIDSGEDMLAEIKALQYNVMENVIIKGIHGIEKISMRDQKSQHYGYDKNTQSFIQVNEWIMDTDGSNLRDVMNNKHIDSFLTTTNNIYEIYEVLGIEAVRKALYNEIIEVLSGIKVNYRHISLLIDTMTNKGNIMPINRHGINRGDAGPLAKCSFEEVTDMLVSAGVFSDFDKINGVSANVMLGQIPNSGTGDGDIIMDEELLLKIATSSKNKNNAHDVEDSNTCDFKINMHLPTGLETNDMVKDIDISFI